MTTACGHCRFFVRDKPTSIYGDCRRFPPIDKGSRWPVTTACEWCGEFAIAVDVLDRIEANRLIDIEAAQRALNARGHNTTDHVVDVRDPVRDGRNSWEPGVQ